MSLRSTEDLRVGLVGAGRWGSNYFAALLATPGLKLDCVCDRDPVALENARLVLPSVAAVDDLDALLDRVDAVVVATPSPTHAPIALRCIEAGKHVLVEKPLALEVDAALAVVERAAEAGRTLLVGHLTLCHPALAIVREALIADAIGRVQSVEATRTSSGARHRRDSALWSLGPHDIANVLFATGSATSIVREAWVSGHDDAGLALELDAGAVARMTWSRSGSVTRRRIRFDGSHGAIDFDEITGVVRLRRDGITRELAAGLGGRLLDLQCARFAAAVRQGASLDLRPAVSVVSVLAAAEVAIARAKPAQRLSAAG